MIITVVGHGPSPTGHGLGSLVDQHPVIRMHDRSWQSEEDYGKRTDYTVIPGPWAARGDNKRFRLKFNERNKPTVAWVAYTLYPKQLVYDWLGRPVLWFDMAWFTELLKPERPGVIDVVPTRGTAAVLIAMEMGFDHIRLLGFDSVVSGKITTYAPGAGIVRDPRWVGKEVNSRHDYGRERDHLLRIARERDVKLEILLSELVAA